MNHEVLTSSIKRIKSVASKKLLLLLTIIACSVFTLHAQVLYEDPAGRIYTTVEQMPKFKGDLTKYLADSIKYPEAERKANISGTVYITFVIERDGALSGIKILRGVPEGPGLSVEAIRVISTMPKWTPGMQDGHPVRVQYTIPIHFKLM